MKILVVANVSDRSEFMLYTELLRRGEQVDLVCDPGETKVDSFRELGGKAYTLKIRHRFDLKAMRFLRDLIKLYDYDVVYSPFNKGLATCAMALIGLPTKLITYRGTLDNISYLNPGDYLTYLNPRLDGVACNCKAVKKSLMKYGLPEEKLSSIYKGHDTDWYNPEEKKNRAEYDLPEEGFLIGCIANMRPLKGINVLLSAFADLPESLQAHLVLVGEARDRNILATVEKHKYKEKIHLLGFRPDATRIAGLFDVAVMPSLRREGLPRSIIESMSQEVPAVVTDIGGMPELVIHNRTGQVIPPNDSKALTNALIHMAEDEQRRAQYGRSGKEHLKEHFGVDTYIAKMQELFRTAVLS